MAFRNGSSQVDAYDWSDPQSDDKDILSECLMHIAMSSMSGQQYRFGINTVPGFRHELIRQQEGRQLHFRRKFSMTMMIPPWFVRVGMLTSQHETAICN